MLPLSTRPYWEKLPICCCPSAAIAAEAETRFAEVELVPFWRDLTEVELFAVDLLVVVVVVCYCC